MIASRDLEWIILFHYPWGYTALQCTLQFETKIPFTLSPYSVVFSDGSHITRAGTKLFLRDFSCCCLDCKAHISAVNNFLFLRVTLGIFKVIWLRDHVHKRWFLSDVKGEIWPGPASSVCILWQGNGTGRSACLILRHVIIWKVKGKSGALWIGNRGK